VVQINAFGYNYSFPFIGSLADFSTIFDKFATPKDALITDHPRFGIPNGL
jgi:hypothetical protein